MSHVFLLGADFSTQGRIDRSYTSMKIIRRYQGIDTFEMYIDRRRLYASLIEGGKFLYFPHDGNLLFMIEREFGTVDENTDTVQVQGRGIDGFALAERKVIPPVGQAYDTQNNVPAETAIKHYVDEHAGPSAVASRQIPNFVIAPDLGRGAELDSAGRYGSLLDVVSEIGRVGGLGWTASYDPAAQEVEFDVVEGTDRASSVFFDFDFATLISWAELHSLLDSKNVAIVAGQGEGEDREVVTRWSGSEPAGFARREAFVDARDVELGNTGLLNQRGDAYLAENGPERALEAKVNPYGAFRPGVHYFIGDIATVRNVDRGLEFPARVVEMHSQWTDSLVAPDITVVLDRPFPTMREQVARTAAASMPIVDLVAAGAGGAVLLLVDNLGNLISAGTALVGPS